MYILICLEQKHTKLYSTDYKITKARFYKKINFHGKNISTIWMSFKIWNYLQYLNQMSNQTKMTMKK